MKKILECSHDCSDDDIHRSFNKLAKLYHPDMLVNASKKETESGKEKFRLILDAFQTLKDPDKRKIYDETGNK